MSGNFLYEWNILFVQRLQRNVIVEAVAALVVLQHNHAGSQWPLFGQIDPRAEPIPTEVDLECFEKANCKKNNIDQSADGIKKPFHNSPVI